VRRPAEPREQPGDHRRVVDRGLRPFVEPAPQPSRRGTPSANARVVLRDQRRELERLAQVDTADLAGGRLREEEVSALEGSVEDCSWVPLGRDGALLPGPGG
jgi:hypothetical protein